MGGEVEEEEEEGEGVGAVAAGAAAIAAAVAAAIAVALHRAGSGVPLVQHGAASGEGIARLRLAGCNNKSARNMVLYFRQCTIRARR